MRKQHHQGRERERKAAPPKRAEGKAAPPNRGATFSLFRLVLGLRSSSFGLVLLLFAYVWCCFLPSSLWLLDCFTSSFSGGAAFSPRSVWPVLLSPCLIAPLLPSGCRLLFSLSWVWRCLASFLWSGPKLSLLFLILKSIFVSTEFAKCFFFNRTKLSQSHNFQFLI